MFKISNLNARIGDKPILHDLNISLQAGDTLLVTGHNGSGKSTLLHAIMGRPDIVCTGSVELLGSELLTLDCHQRAKLGIFMFHQSPPTIDGVNTMTLLNEINRLHDEKYSKRELIDQARALFKNLSLPEDWAKRQFNLGASGGERKKNELVQAELFSGKLMLLDEPDSGLEQGSRDRIVALVNKNSAAGGITLLVTHDKELQQRYQHNSLELQNGRIVKL